VLVVYFTSNYVYIILVLDHSWTRKKCSAFTCPAVYSGKENRDCEGPNVVSDLKFISFL
jgi:hypothetical protein